MDRQVALAPAELAVLRQASYGLSNDQIARELNMAPDTVKALLRRVYLKLGVPDRAGATRVGFERGVLRPRPGTWLASGLPEEGVFRELSRRRPMSDAHIAACFAAEGCPCRGGATWRWHTPDDADDAEEAAGDV